jgi:hypothetical protein
MFASGDSQAGAVNGGFVTVQTPSLPAGDYAVTAVGSFAITSKSTFKSYATASHVFLARARRRTRDSHPPADAPA